MIPLQLDVTFNPCLITDVNYLIQQDSKKGKMKAREASGTTKELEMPRHALLRQLTMTRKPVGLICRILFSLLPT